MTITIIYVNYFFSCFIILTPRRFNLLIRKLDINFTILLQFFPLYIFFFYLFHIELLILYQCHLNFSFDIIYEFLLIIIPYEKSIHSLKSLSSVESQIAFLFTICASFHNFLKQFISDKLCISLFANWTTPISRILI